MKYGALIPAGSAQTMRCEGTYLVKLIKHVTAYKAPAYKKAIRVKVDVIHLN
jgi:hypothetical protein